MTIIKKFEPFDENKKKFSKKFIAFIGCSILILIVLEIWVNNNMVLYGEKFEKISQLQRILKMENQILENEIAKNASLKNLASKSAELGFIKPETVQYIR